MAFLPTVCTPKVAQVHVFVYKRGLCKIVSAAALGVSVRRGAAAGADDPENSEEWDLSAAAVNNHHRASILLCAAEVYANTNISWRFAVRCFGNWPFFRRSEEECAQNRCCTSKHLSAAAVNKGYSLARIISRSLSGSSGFGRLFVRVFSWRAS